MTVSERVTQHWPRTEELVRKDFAATYAAAKSTAIADAIETLWRRVAPGADLPTPAEVDGLSGLVQQHLADMATLHLIPLARDIYMDGKLSEAVAVDNQGGSASESRYDKVRALDQLAERLQSAIAGRAALIADLIAPPTASEAEGDVPQVCEVVGLASVRASLGL
jgi:hypothetical protein